LAKKKKNRLKVKEWEKIFQANINQKQAGVALLIHDKEDSKTKLIRTEKEG
jgi:hypothetical protein